MKKFFKSVVKYVGKFLGWFFFNNWVWVPVFICLSTFFGYVYPLIGEPCEPSWRSFLETQGMNFKMTFASTLWVSSIYFAFITWLVHFVQWLFGMILDFVAGRLSKKEESTDAS